MATNTGDFNITELIDSQELAANLIYNTKASKAGDNSEASQMLGILQQIISVMLCMTDRIAMLEKSKDSSEASQSQSNSQPTLASQTPVELIIWTVWTCQCTRIHNEAVRVVLEQ